jgi:phosphate transport system substrate-binding protein
MPIVVNARRDTTGSQVFIQAAVLQGGKFRTDMQQHIGNLDLVKAVASDPGAIGFAGLTYHIPGIKPVPLAVETGRPYVGIDSVAAAQGEYPLVRPLQLVVNRPPQKNLSRLQAEFLKYVFSQLGQEDVVKAGFQSIAARPAHSALQAVGLGVAQ